MKTIKKILVTLLLVLAVPCWAQAPPRIAWIWPGTPGGNATIVSAFKEGMRENGMVEGKHYILDERYAEGKYDRFPALADELLMRNPAILMVNTIASVRAAQQATKTVPIVFVHTNDPVGSGLVASLARPGGNTTGLSTQNEDVVEKYIELLRELLPRASRIAVLINPGNPSGPKMFERNPTNHSQTPANCCKSRPFLTLSCQVLIIFSCILFCGSSGRTDDQRNVQP